MQNLFIITQKVDEHDDLLGSFVDWIREFRKHVPHVSIAALHTPYVRPKSIRWAVLTWRILWEAPRSDAVFCHMSPMFAVIAGPWARLWGKPVYLWYLHRSLTWKLKIAAFFCTKIFTASAESLTLKSPKIIAVGHGINMSRFQRNDELRMTNDEARILSVGRISPIKDYETLLKTGFPITIVGRPIMSYDFGYFEKLKQYKNATFAGFVPYSHIVDYYHKADIVVNCSPTGGIDKTVLEGMAAGCLVLVANRAFASTIRDERCFFKYGNTEDLREKIETIQNMTVTERKAMSSKLLGAVREYHSLPVTIKKILAAI